MSERKTISGGVVTVRRVSVRPTRNTLGFAVLILAMWYAAVSQGNGAAYALLFFLGSVGAISWLHARRNLRGLTLRAGRIEPVFAGSDLRVPLSLTTETGNFAAGVELRPLTGGDVVRTGFVTAGTEVDATLLIRAPQRGAFQHVRLELRSLWPFGIFAARTRIELPAPHLVHPAPEGAQPLQDGDPGWQYERRTGRGDGDEFAGLREIRPGESPRRIHWRAAERTERLLIKEWEGASGGLRWLEWSAVTATSREERLSQLARWVLEADRAGIPYGLRLPGSEIPAGMGPAHRARCLQALANFPGEPEPVAKPKRKRQPEPPILPRPFGMLLVALAIGVVPLLSSLLPFSAVLLGGAIVFRFITRHRGAALRSVPLKLLVCGIGVGGVLFSGGELLGLKPGMSLLVGLMALKILESVTRRDFFVLMLLTWFMALCGLFLSQTLIAGLSAAGLSVLAAFAGAALYSHDRMPLGMAARRIGLILAQAIPIIVLLFVFFPRIHAGIRPLTAGGLGAAGFSEDFDPGSFAELTDNFETAFRVEFPDGENPHPADRYWRGVVLWECRGLSWRRGSVHSLDPLPRKRPAKIYRQKITLQPHGKRWLFALDRPISAPKNGSFEPGACIQANSSINRSTRYEVTSAPGVRDEYLPKQRRLDALSLPRNIPPETRKLAEWLKTAGEPAEILARGVEWFQAQGFTYSLEPKVYEGSGALDEFLFQRRTGFCSHYASAFATLMRAAGLPSRVVLGYQGGEYNPNGKYFQIRQNDAHAWAEVWIDRSGWQRIDLTQQLAPERIEIGAMRYRDNEAMIRGGGFRPPAGLRDLFDRARMFWDSVNYEWDLRVVAYDEDAQFEFLARTGFKDIPRPALLGGILIATSVLFGIAWLWLRRVTRARLDPAAIAWSRACEQIARISGITREPWEGPHAYAQRASVARPDAAEPIHDASQLYSLIRFAAAPPELHLLDRATDRLRAIERLKPQTRAA